MRSEQKLARARRRRSRRLLTTSAVAAGLVVGVVAAGAAYATAPLSLPDASGTNPTFVTTPVAIGSPLTAPAGVALLNVTTGEATAALGDARAALADANLLASDVATSGLDLGADSALDTSALRRAIDRLTSADIAPALLFPDLAADATAQAEATATRVASLRERLDAARAQQAAEEAAAAAQREAEEAAAALAAANTPEGAQATARQLASSQYGWGDGEFSCLVSLWNKESSWNYQAYNASSGATGIPQALPGDKMASAGADWQTSAATQVAWGLDYISRAYGSPCGAWSHSQATNWY